MIVPVGFEPPVRCATSAIDWPTVAEGGLAVVVSDGVAMIVTVSPGSPQPPLAGLLSLSPL